MALPQRGRRRWLTLVAIVAVVVAAGVIGSLLWHLTWLRRGLPAAVPGTTVAIVAFNNLSHNPEDAWLGSALPEMLATEVTASGKLNVLPSGLVRPARADLPAPMAGGFSPAGLATLRKRLGADYVISGSYLVSGTGAGANVRVDFVLQDARGGAGIVEFSRSQSASRLLQLVAGAGSTLRTKLGLPAIVPGQASRLASGQPPSSDVARGTAVTQGRGPRSSKNLAVDNPSH